MLKRLAWLLAISLNFWVVGVVNAQLVDDIEVKAVGNRAEATLRLSAQVRLVRSAVASNGKILQIFFQITQASESVSRVVEEERKSPPFAPVEPFTVMYSPINQTGVRRLDIVFKQPVKPTVRIGPDGRSFLITLPVLRSPADRATTAVAPPTTLPVVPPPPSSVPPPATPITLPTAPVASADTLATLKRAKDALAKNDFETALAQFNILLNQPQNETTVEAQELVGVAREGLGQTKPARAEYELFLKLYPTGDGADRVRARLKALDSAPAAGTAASGSAPGAPKPASTTYWGSLSQSYYGGQSRIDTSTIIVTPATNATIIDQQTITGTDQSSLVTNLDLNARYRSGDWDTKLAVRDTYNLSFLKRVANQNRLTAAYADVRNQADRYNFRIGRQSPSGAGVLYRFDGLSANYAFTPVWKVAMVAGTPSDATLGERKSFYGASIDAEGLFPNVGGTFYAIEQRAGGQTDRRALGTEMRFNSERVNAFGTFDYDVLFRRINIGSLQATYNIPDSFSFNALYDYRASPPLQLTNGLGGLGVFTLAEALALTNLTTLQRYSSALTPVSRVASFGVTVPLGKAWQAGIDYRISSVSAGGDTPAIPASPASGQVKTVTAQLIGSGVWGASDVLVLNGSYLNAPTYTGWLLALNTRFVFATNWTAEPIIRWYRQTNSDGPSLVRWSPTFRGTYRWSDKISMDAEISWELSKSLSAIVNQNSNHLFYYIGYRYDF